MLGVQVQYWNLVESKRHNKADEALTSRNLDIQFMNAETNRYNADTNRLMYHETVRHNVAVEGLQERANDINMFNAQTNSRNANTNEFNAQTNRMNALTNAAMIPIQATMAAASMQNAEAAIRNAASNEKNASTNVRRQQNDWWRTQQEIDLRKTDLGIAQQSADAQTLNAQTSAERNQIQREYNDNFFELEGQKVDISRHHLNLERVDTVNNIVNNAWRNANESVKIIKTK